MLRHQFRQDLILALNLFLQELDAFLLGLVVGAGFGLEGRGPVLEELLLPAVEYRRLQPQVVAGPKGAERGRKKGRKDGRKGQSESLGS